MIVTYDKKFPNELIIELDSLLEMDVITFKKVFNYYLEEISKKKYSKKIILDLYKICDYTYYCIKDIIIYFTYINKELLSNIKEIEIYVNKDNSYQISLLDNINYLV